MSLYFARGDTDQGAQGPVLSVAAAGTLSPPVITGSSHVAASQYFGTGSASEQLQQRGDQRSGRAPPRQGDYRVYVTPGQTSARLARRCGS